MATISKDYFIKQIDDTKLKSKITDSILRQLPEWFGIEEAIVEYVEKAKEMTFYVAFNNDKPIGFYPLEENIEMWGEQSPCLLMVIGL